MKEHDLYEFLRALPEEAGTDHTTLLTSFFPEFLGILGYEGATIFFDFLLSLPGRLQADAMVGKDRSGKAVWMYVEVRTFRAMRDDPESVWKRVRSSYEEFLTANGEWLLLFSPRFLGLKSKSDDRLYDLLRLTEEEASQVYLFLQREKFSDRQSEHAHGIHPEAVV